MKLTKRNISKGFTLVELLVVIAIIAALAAMATPVVMKQQKKAAMTQATNNAKQIFLLLFDFDQEFGQFPDSDDSAGLGSTGTSTNAIMRQLFIGGYTKSEEIFYAKSKISKKPDGDIGNATAKFPRALEKGECGFLYIDNQSTGDNSARPILAAPLKNNTSVEFDKDMYGGKAMALRIDGSVQQYRIQDSDSKAVTKIGNKQVDIFSTQNPVWDDTTIKPRYPEKK